MNYQYNSYSDERTKKTTCGLCVFIIFRDFKCLFLFTALPINLVILKFSAVESSPLRPKNNVAFRQSFASFGGGSRRRYTFIAGLLPSSWRFLFRETLPHPSPGPFHIMKCPNSIWIFLEWRKKMWNETRKDDTAFIASSL